MNAPPPPAPVSPRTVAACLLLASLVALVVAAYVAWSATTPILPPAEPRPAPAETTAAPIHPRASEESR